MPERVACQSALAWARRPRRLTPLPWPSPRAPALEAAEDGHVEGLQVRRELLLHGGHRGLAGVDAGRVPEKDPRLSFLDRVQHVVQNGRELQDRFITGLFPARNLIFITVLNKFQKLAAGENYRRYSFILIPKQLVCNASNL